jgi:hypothetical protein
VRPSISPEENHPESGPYKDSNMDMEKHITVVAVLWLALGGLGFFVAIIAFVAIVGGGALSGDMEAIAITGTVGTAIAGLLVVLSVPALIAGIGLLKKAEWARILTLVLAFLNLMNIPFGTALGVYSIWVLLNAQATPLFAASSRT